MARRRSYRPGLTLLEVLLVMAIMVILGVVAYPTLSAMYGDVKVRAAADQVRASCAEGRARAIEEGRAYRIGVQPNTGLFRLAPDGLWDDAGGLTADENAPPPYVEEGELTRPIVFVVPPDLPAAGDWSIVLVFNPDGTCSQDVEISLQDDDNSSPVVVRVRALTGAVTVRKRSATPR